MKEKRMKAHSEERKGFQVDAICARGLGTGKRSQGLVVVINNIPW